MVDLVKEVMIMATYGFSQDPEPKVTRTDTPTLKLNSRLFVKPKAKPTETVIVRETVIVQPVYVPVPFYAPTPVYVPTPYGWVLAGYQ